MTAPPNRLILAGASNDALPFFLTASYAGCKIQIGYLEQRLAERDITLEVTDAALDLLGEAGFDPIHPS